MASFQSCLFHMIKKMKSMAPHRASTPTPLLCLIYFHFIFFVHLPLSRNQRVLFATLVMLRVMGKVKRSDR